MSYQERILKFGEEKIFSCPRYKKDGACHNELADVSGGRYKHGPEICFVGERYGQTGFPRILFTRLNSIWPGNIGFFGTLESFKEYQRQNPNYDISEVFRRCLKGWKYDGREYRGLWDAGTVTGHPNKSPLAGAEKRKKPKYGIQIIMEEMIGAGIFPKDIESPLEFCAINNVIKCAGNKPKSNPTEIMKSKCNYYQKELDILEPNIIVVFGSQAHDYLGRRFSLIPNQIIFRPSSGRNYLYFKFPHPLPPGKHGKNNWLRDLRLDPSNDREPGLKEKEAFYFGPKGTYTTILFKYTLYLVGITKKLKADFIESEVLK